MGQKQVDTRLLDALRNVRDGYRYDSAGICGHVKYGPRDAGNAEMKRLDELMRRWPEFSGNGLYPIRSNKRVHPAKQYSLALGDGSLWSTTKPYGKARWRLLHWLIAELEATR